MPLLAAPAMTVEPSCPHCGATDWWHGPDGTTACHACLLAGRTLVSAVKVYTDALETEIWVVCDDLPREAWPTDAPVYTHAEVKILREVGPDTLAWVHATKTMFDAQVVDGGRRPAAAPDTIGEEVNDG